MSADRVRGPGTRAGYADRVHRAGCTDRVHGPATRARACTRARVHSSALGPGAAIRYARPVIRQVLGVLGLLAACTTTSVADSSDPPASDPASLHPDMVVDGPDAPAPTTTPAAGPRPDPLPYNCQAPLTVIEEVGRMMTVAATHATTSSACVDGPGHRVTIDEILVCPRARDGTRQPYAVDFRVTTWPEGGRQICGGKCPPVVPEQTQHQVELLFRVDGAQLVLEPPASLPGLPPDATPVGQAHDGDCYGKSPAFAPRPVTP